MINKKRKTDIKKNTTTQKIKDRKFEGKAVKVTEIKGDG